jgi:methyl-accepting chemotaxis protein
MDALSGEAEKLMQIVDEVNGRITTLAASTEEIAASTDMVNEITNDLKEKFDTIART